jgi:AAA ATPase domain
MSTSFFGREEELARLQRLFELAAERDSKGRSVHGPRMAVIVAHTGVGKTRLAQELYRWLASHPIWDAANFWPDDLGSEKDSLRVNPIVEPCSARPQFVWWGLRACNHGDRNATAVAAFDEHQIPLRHLVAVLRGGRELGRSAIATGVDLLKDAILPTGLAGAWKLGKQAMELRRERQRSSGGSEGAAREALADELIKEVQSLMALKLPMVLLCDDMQWVDAETLDFVDRLWVMAQEQGWPLLIVSTHWETEWNQACRLKSEDRADTFAKFSGLANVEQIHLQCSPSKDLVAWVTHELPGLTNEQVALLVEKAGSNFLQLVQNVQPLKRKVAIFFEDGRLDRPLNRKGVAYVGSFETDPDRRARQLFDELSESMQVVLGWGSHIGMRFLREVVVDFAQAMGVKLAQEPAASIDEATDPMALLAESSERTREFRQGAFYQQAQRVLGVHGYDKARLDGALRQVLIHWIQRSFNEHGEIVSPKDGRSVSALPHEEQRDLLIWASDLLPIPAVVDWEDETHVAAVRARVLLEESIALLLADGEPYWVHIDALWGLARIPDHVVCNDQKERLRSGLYVRPDFVAMASWSHGQWGEDTEEYLSMDRAYRLERARTAGDRDLAVKVLGECLVRGLPPVAELATHLGMFCARGLFVEEAQLASVVAAVRSMQGQSWQHYASLLGQVQAVEGEVAAIAWLEEMKNIAELDLAKQGDGVRMQVASNFVSAVKSMPKRGFERVKVRAYAAGLAFVVGVPRQVIPNRGTVAEWFFDIATLQSELGDAPSARQNLELSVDWVREWIAAQVDLEERHRIYFRNDMVWYSCCLARLYMASQEWSSAWAVLDAVECHVADLLHPTVDNRHFLDSAATVFELRSQIANAMGNTAMAHAADSAASEIRSRIADLTSRRGY